MLCLFGVGVHLFEEVVLYDPDNPVRKCGLEGKDVHCENNLEWYVFRCGQTLARLSCAIDKCHLSLNQLEYVVNKKRSDDKFTHADYIEYEIENFLIRSSAIYDRALILASSLHDLGIADDSISHQSVITNAHVQSSGMADQLKKLRKHCTEFREMRNKIVHHANYTDEAFDLLSMLHKLDASEKQGSSVTLPQDVLIKLTDDFIHIQISEFKEYLNSIVESVEKIYDKSLLIYATNKIRNTK
nr:Cthe_2314 family HEPN domain-containing protein [Aeromonas veronii]